MIDLPVESGQYALFLRLLTPKKLSIGRLGIGDFPAGNYLYFGSARGSGGLRARLGRHLRGAAKLHWHIDTLRIVAQVYGFCYLKDQHFSKQAIPVECLWSQRLRELPAVQVPLPGFGASDCKSGCDSHLFYLANTENEMISHYRKIFAASVKISIDSLTCQMSD